MDGRTGRAGVSPTETTRVPYTCPRQFARQPRSLTCTTRYLPLAFAVPVERCQAAGLAGILTR